MKVQVRDFMSSPVVTTTIDSNVAYIRELMERKDVSAIPVVELKSDGLRVRGIVSTFDMMGVCDESLNVTEIMSTEVKIVNPEMGVIQAASMMMDQNIHHLIVMEKNRIIGMVSSMDFVRLISEKKMRNFANIIFV